MRRTFTTLDGLRGTAAIVVVLYHGMSVAMPDMPAMRSAYLAVDLFFLLSGFVIGHAYDAKLAAGMGLGRFARVRMLRLYPLYLLGLGLALATPVTIAVVTHHWWAAKPALLTLPWAMVLLPHLVQDPDRWFLLNPPAWSLFYELLGNIVYTMLIARLDKRMLSGILLVSGTVLAVLSIRYGTLNLNADRTLWAIGNLMRMTFSFSAGLLIHRLWRDGKLPAVRMPAGVTILVLLGLIGLAGIQPWSPVSTAIVVIVGFPLLLIAGIANEPSALTRSLMHETGRISYALYVLHWPIMVAFVTVAGSGWMTVGSAIMLTIPVSLAAAWLASRYYDEPIRRWLTSRVLGQRNRSTGVTEPMMEPSR